MRQTITIRLKLRTKAKDEALLFSTMTVYREACNYVSAYIFNTHDLKQGSLSKVLYYQLREKFALRSQMAQSVIKTVIARYKTVLTNQKDWIKPVFKKPQYELVWNRDYSLTNNCFSVNTLEGRLRLSYCSKPFEKYFNKDTYQFGTAKLVCRDNKYYLHIPISYDIKECVIDDICHITGIDRGINFIAATYDSKRKSCFYDGHVIKHKRANYKRLRKELQQVKTASSRRKLKKIGQRETRWIQDVNHCVSKALVESNPKHTLFVLEDLSGIRSVTEQVCLKNRYMTVSWAYYDLEQKLMYKAAAREQMVIKTDPRYTSQRCPVCGYIDRNNRNKRLHTFTCKRCSYTSNDDRIGAMNLYLKGLAYIEDTVAGEQVSPARVAVNQPAMQCHA